MYPVAVANSALGLSVLLGFASICTSKSKDPSFNKLKWSAEHKSGVKSKAYNVCPALYPS